MVQMAQWAHCSHDDDEDDEDEMGKTRTTTEPGNELNIKSSNDYKDDD